ncbi:beta-N-acetylhexosaminidase [Chondrinema litorale]|uniref:beta-N-acetylhexosaminidase n=1 Tax=Chondrinema litorale TaxID=2994555 RepID=UPI0025432304|nr:family 20 glycosylhydrolase [Chondrinema litorale]UZR97496.1 family 20 glycosylhydrolase [Chondrinema litorale]
MIREIVEKTLILLVLVAFGCNKQQQNDVTLDNVSIIPEPASLTKGNGSFEINKSTKIYFQAGHEELSKIAETFSGKLEKAAGFALQIEASANATDVSENSILFTTESADASLGGEGYTLDVTKTGVVAKAIEPAGIFYAMQSIKQLLPPEIESTKQVNDISWRLPVVSVKDTPRFAWRGMHLDVSRHMSSVEFVKKYIDNMAMHKLNTFHWHLTDDQGWRIEIKKYPKLTEIGAWRDETLVGHAGSTKYDGKRYGGFYTQEEIKEVVDYAQKRYITVVPEIEMPGHATAAVAAYPELGVTGNRPDVVKEWGVFLDIYGVQDETFEFLENVLLEVFELFPSKYIHIGGDEAWKDQWDNDPKVQAKIKELGLKDSHELQSWFITRMEKFINEHDRQIIGWDEILEGGLAPNAAVMSWRGEEGGIEAAKQKHYVVMTPGSHVYFDHFQGDPKFEPLQFGGFTTLEKVYSYNPTPDDLTDEEKKYILGAQANVWSEYLPTSEKVEYVVFPRMAALSEVVWSPLAKKSWETFKEKIPEQLQRYDYRGINYSKSIYYVTYHLAKDSSTNKFTVTLKNQFELPDMRYTLNGGDPTSSSELYESPLILEEGTVIKAGLFEDKVIKGKVTEITVKSEEDTKKH